MKTYKISYTKDGYGGTQYRYATITSKGIATMRKRLIAEGLPMGGNCFFIYEGYNLIGFLTNRQPAYPGIWLWSGSGGWRTVNPKTGCIGAEVFDHNYYDIRARMERKR